MDIWPSNAYSCCILTRKHSYSSCGISGPYTWLSPTLPPHAAKNTLVLLLVCQYFHMVWTSRSNFYSNNTLDLFHYFLFLWSTVFNSKSIVIFLFLSTNSMFVQWEVHYTLLGQLIEVTAFTLHKSCAWYTQMTTDSNKWRTSFSKYCFFLNYSFLPLSKQLCNPTCLTKDPTPVCLPSVCGYSNSVEGILTGFIWSFLNSVKDDVKHYTDVHQKTFC